MKTRSITLKFLALAMLSWLPTAMVTAEEDERPERPAERRRIGPEEREAMERQARDRERALDELRARLKEILAHDQMEQAAEVKEKIARLEREAPQRFKEAEAREQERRANVKMEIAELHRLGKHEEAERLEQKGREQAGSRDRDRERAFERREAPDGRPAREIEELHQRLHHLTVAIEHLHLAGMHEPAERLQAQAEEMRRHLEQRGQPGGREMARREERIIVREGHPEMIQELRNNLEELRGQVGELRRALREMRAQLEQRSRERENP